MQVEVMAARRSVLFTLRMSAGKPVREDPEIASAAGRRSGWLDKEALQRVLTLCRLASTAIEDQVCRHQIGIVSVCSGALFSEGRSGNGTRSICRGQST
jgi:hypothetical protein